MFQEAGGVRLQLDATTSIFLPGIKTTDLDTSDFTFV